MQANVVLTSADGHTVSTTDATICQFVEGLIRSELDLLAVSREAEGGRRAFAGRQATD